jgi:hypothetical protein
MKRKPAAKKKVHRKSYGVLKKEAWEAFSRYIRIRDSLATTGRADRCRCITCGRVVPTFKSVGSGNSLQAGHAIDKRTNNILFDEDIVNGQCALCNSTYGGNGRYAEYAAVMIQRHGLDWWNEKVRFARLPAEKPWRSGNLIEIKEKYQKKLEEILK